MTDRLWLGIAIVFCLVIPEQTFWWFPGISLAFFVGRWSTS